MKIILINPVIKDKIWAGIPKNCSEDIFLFPPFGLMYIQSYLDKFSHHETKTIDDLLISVYMVFFYVFDYIRGRQPMSANRRHNKTCYRRSLCLCKTPFGYRKIFWSAGSRFFIRVSDICFYCYSYTHNMVRLL